MNDGTTIDCRSEVGVTVGLIDAMISIARIVAKRDLKNPAVEEAAVYYLVSNPEEDLLEYVYSVRKPEGA